MSFISNNIIPWKNSTLIISKKQGVYFKFPKKLSTILKKLSTSLLIHT